MIWAPVGTGSSSAVTRNGLRSLPNGRPLGLLTATGVVACATRGADAAPGVAASLMADPRALRRRPCRLARIPGDGRLCTDKAAMTATTTIRNNVPSFCRSGHRSRSRGSTEVSASTVHPASAMTILGEPRVAETATPALTEQHRADGKGSINRAAILQHRCDPLTWRESWLPGRSAAVAFDCDIRCCRSTAAMRCRPTAATCWCRPPDPRDADTRRPHTMRSGLTQSSNCSALTASSASAASRRLSPDTWAWWATAAAQS